MKKTIANKYKYLLIIFIMFCFSNLYAQKGYAKDSLQIKVYTEIDYVNSLAKAINVKKVFCDYCSDNQLIGIEDEALRRSYIERNLKKNRVKDGKKKLAIYIRISKSDFAYLENNQEMSLESYLVKNMEKNSKTANSKINEAGLSSN